MFSCAQQGKLRILVERFEEYLRDARRRGDLYFEATLVRYGHRAFLTRGRCEYARSEINRVVWPTPKDAFHLQHWFELEAHCQISLYEGNSHENLKTNEKSFFRLEHSLLLRVQIIRSIAYWLKARLLVARKGDSANLDKAIKICKKLEKEKVVTYPKVFAACVRSAVFFQKGDKEKSIVELRYIIELSEENQLLLQLNAAKYRLGNLLGGENEECKVLLADVLQYCEEEGIVDPPRMFEVVIPGFFPG